MSQKSTPKKRVSAREPAIRIALRTNLRNRRVELGVSQKKLGDVIGTTQQWIQQLEAPNTDCVPSVYQLEDLAEALQCQPHDLLVPGRFDAGISPKDDMREYQHRTR